MSVNFPLRFLIPAYLEPSLLSYSLNENVSRSVNKQLVCCCVIMYGCQLPCAR